MTQKLLIVEDQSIESIHVQSVLEGAGYQVVGIARSVNVALQMIEANFPSLVILDIFLKGALTGIHLGSILREKGIAFIYLSANSNRDTLELAKTTEPAGFLVKPFRPKDLLISVEIALYVHEQRAKLNSTKKQLRGRSRAAFPVVTPDRQSVEVVGNSPAFKSLLEDVRLVAPAETTVLLLGETGTGKELIANTIHQLSPRRTGPLVKINCAAIPDSLIESILFGHEHGAFTGATQRKRGKFEQAQGGTIFLDEIGEITPEMQVKFLRVLQEKEIELLGGEEVIKVDCRVIAATNRDLEADVSDGRFRMDLYYRLTVFPIVLPPLRDRVEDIPDLARHFVSLYSKKMGRPAPELSAGVIEEFLKFSWPGNIRELEHVIERAVLVNKGNIITRIELSKKPSKQQLQVVNSSKLDDVEKEHIIAVLQACKGRVAGRGGAAEILNMNTSTLYSRMKKLGINKSRNFS